MDMQLCPIHKSLPTTKISKGILKYHCSIYCSHFGCKLGWPLVASGFTKQSAINKAAAEWDKEIQRYNDGILLI